MNEEEVKTLIGKDKWKEFLKWLRGQTVGINEDGTTDYYDGDVTRFFNSEKLTYIQQSKDDPWKCKCGMFHTGFPYNCPLKVRGKKNGR